MKQFIDDLRALQTSATAVAALTPLEIKSALVTLDRGSGTSSAHLLKRMEEVEQQFVRIKSVLLQQS